MEYVIGGIGIIICIFLVGFFTKKKYYKEVDRLEAWKIDITNRPVLEEMLKVKQLNMNGQTEESFERWRNEWDDIVTVQLPDLEDYLYEAEEFIDKYRFKKAKEVQLKIEGKLNDTEDKIKNLLKELNELVGSEEKNRTDIEELKDIYRESKKSLLAHRHTFGKAEVHLEKRLKDTSEKFALYEESTDNGNYLEARQIVLTIKEILEKIKYDMEIIPDLLVECQSTIPIQLTELKEGYKEMAEQGYALEHINVEEETQEIIGKLNACLKSVEQADLDDMQKEIEEIKEKVDILYDLLEKEVLAKHTIDQNYNRLREMLQSLLETNDALVNEVELIQQSYHLHNSELGGPDKLEKKIAQLFKRYELLEFKIGGQSAPYSHLSVELLSVREQLNIIANEQLAFSEKLQALRKDELSAREKVKELGKKIAETIRLVSKSNLPGVPREYKYLLEDAQGSIQQVIEKLNEKPLDIPIVQQYLDIAVLTVEKVTVVTEELFETVQLAEKVIQYGNRYRSGYPSVNKALQEAEQLFRSYEYKAALEQAASSIEEIEPGALKKIETLL